MKPTTDGRWAHLACAMWILETCLSDIKKMEPVDGMNRISKDRWKLLSSMVFLMKLVSSKHSKRVIWLDRVIARLQQPFPLECIPVEAEYQDMLRPIHVALVSCSRRFQKGENQEGEDETDIDVDDTNGRRLSWHLDMDNGL
nr:histone-lysine N-methyltransferase ATX2-like [Tanacetum cinerariifolium]